VCGVKGNREKRKRKKEKGKKKKFSVKKRDERRNSRRQNEEKKKNLELLGSTANNQLPLSCGLVLRTVVFLDVLAQGQALFGRG